MQVVLPDEALPVKLTFNSDLRMNDDEYYDFCMANRDLNLERTAQGEIIILPLPGAESDYQAVQAGAQLRMWAKKDGRGRGFGSSAEFILPTGAALSPDAAWLSNERLAALTREQRREFPPACPEFVIEMMSPTDRLRSAKEKMKEWMKAGVELAWLIHPDKETVYVYYAGQEEPDTRTGIVKLAGEGPVLGFELDLTDLWAGL